MEEQIIAVITQVSVLYRRAAMEGNHRLVGKLFQALEALAAARECTVEYQLRTVDEFINNCASK